MYRLVEAKEAGRRPGSAVEPIRPSGARRRQRQRQRQASGMEIGCGEGDELGWTSRHGYLGSRGEKVGWVTYGIRRRRTAAGGENVFRLRRGNGAQ